VQLSDILALAAPADPGQLRPESRVIVQIDHTEFCEPVEWRVGRDPDGSPVLIIDIR
jgi:hypothetical protein